MDELDIKSKGNRNFLPKFLFLLKETETNFCLFGFGLAETENLLQILVANRNFCRNKIPCMMVLTIVQLGLKLNTKFGLDHPPPPTHNKLF